MARKGSSENKADLPYIMRLADGRTVFVLVPGAWTEADVSGQVAFTPSAIRLLDRVRALAMAMPASPSPGFVRTLREALGMTQAQLAQRLHVDKLTVARWEWGKVRPRPATLRALDQLRRQAARRGVVIGASAA